MAIAGVAAERGTAEQVLALVEKVLTSAETAVQGIDAVAVSRGPGSLTGLRVGIGTARGIALGIGKPLVGVSCLRAIAAGLGAGPPTLALIDAGKGEVYGCLFEPGEPPHPLGRERVAPPEAFAQAVTSRRIRIAGPGAGRYRDLFAPGSWIQTPSEELLAGSIGLLAWARLNAAAGEPSGGPDEDNQASPRYLRREGAPVSFHQG